MGLDSRSAGRSKTESDASQCLRCEHPACHHELDKLAALLQVVTIDLVLAGDNAIVIGLAAPGLSLQQHAKAVLVGVVAATILRITFAAATTQLLQVVGLVLAGGILLLWVSWKMFRELRLSVERKRDAIETKSNMDINADGTIASRGARKSFAQAASQIVVADVSMSFDNVLAVAGAAREHPAILIIELTLSVGLTGIAAGYIAGAPAQAPVDRLRRIARDRVCRSGDDLPRDG